MRALPAGFAIVVLAALCVSCTGVERVKKDADLSCEESVLDGGFTINVNAFQMGGRYGFPDSVTNGFHGGWFVRWLSEEEERRLEASMLYETFKNVPSTRDETHVAPYLLGAIKGQPCYMDGRGAFDISSTTIEGAVLRVDVDFINIVNPSTSYAGGVGYYAISLASLPDTVSYIDVKFSEWFAYEEFGAESPAVDNRTSVPERRLTDVRIDVRLAFAREAHPDMQLSAPHVIEDHYPQSDCGWSWQVKRNWRGIDVLDGPLICQQGGKEADRWNFVGDSRGGPAVEKLRWWYRTDDGSSTEVQVTETGNYAGGKREGDWLGTYEDGSACYERVYAAGELMSEIGWYPDGKRLVESTRDGDVVTTRYYFTNGLQDCEVSYLGGVKHGFQRFWWDNGQLREERQYDKFRPVGVWRRWNPDGKLIQEDKDPKPGFPLNK
jgi:hypothetical protein